MIIAIVITLVLLLLSGYFSASETSLFSIGREQFAALSKGDKRDVAIYRLLNNGEDTLIVILLANLMVNLSIISSLSTVLTELFDPSLFMKMIYSTLILLIFGEVIPKNIALGFTMKIARFSAPNLLFLQNVLAPVVSLFKKVNRTLIRFNYRFILRKPQPFVTTEEYESALKTTVEKGQLSSESALFLSTFLHFTEKPLLPAAIHRSEVGGFREEPESTSSLGVALTYNQEGEVTAINGAGWSEEPLWYPSTGSIGDFLSFAKGNRRRSALLLDEYGSYYGVATVSVVLEHLRNSQIEASVEQQEITLDGAELLVKYREWFPMDMLNAFPDIKTVSGLVTSWFGEIPESGSVLEVQSCIFHIVVSDGRKICTLKIKKRSSL